MKIGEFEFKEGTTIYIGAYIFQIRRGMCMLQKISVAGGLGYVDFEPGILLLLLQHVDCWSFQEKE